MINELRQWRLYLRIPGCMGVAIGLIVDKNIAALTIQKTAKQKKSFRQ